MRSVSRPPRRTASGSVTHIRFPFRIRASSSASRIQVNEETRNCLDQIRHLDTDMQQPFILPMLGVHLSPHAKRSAGSCHVQRACVMQGSKQRHTTDLIPPFRGRKNAVSRGLIQEFMSWFENRRRSSLERIIVRQRNNTQRSATFTALGTPN